MSSAILGASALSIFGEGLETLAEGIQTSTAPDREEKTVEYNGHELRVSPFKIPKFTLKADIPTAVQRRLGHFARMSFQAILLALEESKLEFEDPSRVGIIVGTGNGPVSTDNFYLSKLAKYGGKGASPTYFANSIHNTAASFIAISLGITGPISTVVNLELSSAVALDTANTWLEADLVDYVLVAIGDELYNYQEITLCIENYKVLNDYNPLERDNIVPGEGFVGLILAKADDKKAQDCLKIHSSTNSSFKEINFPEKFILDIKGDTASYDFAKTISKNKEVLSYSSMYGSFSTGGALDLAIAIHGLREGLVYKSTTTSEEFNTLDSTLVDQERIDLFQVATRGEIGAISLER
ncbi:hypothetical protein A9Q84_05485 [Halobacteriovorax marinus]|uniref:Beta-ketoacyl synthase-like N-terminal domain-containing protein n=1 Tax=Halobacteriovorax marinus TaxID=97084 RepID=A0A1Y5FHQ6_9BACT|nr:hypothetical protein A9Q84_05485 [Halobacteriovorax marinus]